VKEHQEEEGFSFGGDVYAKLDDIGIPAP